MLHIIKKITPQLMLITLLTTLCAPKAAALEDAIVAIVNEEVITLKNLRDYIQKAYVSLIAEGRSDHELKTIMADLEKNGLKKLIEEKLILSKANEVGLKIRDQLIDDRINELKAKYPSEKVFIESLIANGATITDLKNKIRDQLKIKSVIDYEVRSKVFVNPQEVTDYYESHMADFQIGDRVNLESIHIPFSGNRAKAEERLKEAQKFIDEGISFKEVAKYYSDTSFMGIIERGQVKPEIEAIVFNLKKGEISSVLEVENGFYIFKLTEKIPARIAALKEVKGHIQDILYMQKFQQKITEWLDKLKSRVYVDIKE